MSVAPNVQNSGETAGIAPERGFLVALARDAKLAARSKGEVIQALAFFIVVVSLFPLAIGPESALLKRIAPGVVWVAALLSVAYAAPAICKRLRRWHARTTGVVGISVARDCPW